MNLAELLEQIEGRIFDAHLNTASGFGVLLMALERSEVLNELIAELRRQPQSKQIAFQHLTDLLKANDEPEYAHPYDAAIAGYLFALSCTDTKLTCEAIEAVLQTPQLWWSRRLAKYIRKNLSMSTTQAKFVDIRGQYTQLEALSPQTKDQIETVKILSFAVQDGDQFQIGDVSKSKPVERIVS
jgi:hypothetical protein